MKVLASGFIHDSRTAPFHQRSCARTTVTLLHDGTLLATCRLGSDRESLDGHEAVFASADSGATWTMRYHGYNRGAWGDTPGEVKAFTIAELEPGVLTATGLWTDRSRPDCPFIHPETQGLLPMRVFHTTSTDGGYTWGPRQWMDTSPHPGASCTTQALYQLPEGTLAQPYEHWKEYDDPAPAHPGAWFRLSHDGGQTWPEYLPVATHPGNTLYYWDQRLARHPETGQWVALFWTHEPDTGLDRDVHIACGAPDARSWTTPVGTGLPGQHCQPVPLGGDFLLAVYAQRGNPPGIAASLSADFGRSWDRSQDIMVYDSTAGVEHGAAGSRSQKDKWNDMIAWRFGHPRGLLLPSGEALIVYYAGDDQYKSACWARIGAFGLWRETKDLNHRTSRTRSKRSGF